MHMDDKKGGRVDRKRKKLTAVAASLNLDSSLPHLGGVKGFVLGDKFHPIPFICGKIDISHSVMILVMIVDKMIEHGLEVLRRLKTFHDSP